MECTAELMMSKARGIANNTLQFLCMPMHKKCVWVHTSICVYVWHEAVQRYVNMVLCSFSYH